MSMKSFLDQYRWQRIDETEPCLFSGQRRFVGQAFLIIDPRSNEGIGFAYSADDAQKIVDALNRVPVVGPVEADE